MYPGRFMEITQAGHRFNLAVQFRPVIFPQLTTITFASTSIINVRLTVIIYKYTRVYFRGHTFDITSYTEFLIRILTGSDSHPPGTIPICSIGRMREVEIIGLILRIISTIWSPHEAITTPTIMFPHCGCIHYLPMIGPVHHIFRRKDMVTIHTVASKRRLHIMRSIYIKYFFSINVPYMCRSISRVERSLYPTIVHR